MLMTGQTTIQEVLLFPTMKPEKVARRDKAERFVAVGVPAEWVPVVQKAGYLTVVALGAAVPGKLFQEVCGVNKKYKLELKNPAQTDVEQWVNAAAADAAQADESPETED
jgi:lysyl-tRNA synthetase class 2